MSLSTEGRTAPPSEPASFRALYDIAFPRVYGYLLRRAGGAALAEDLTQETFVAALNEARAGRVAAPSLPWLIGVARHKLVDHFRRLEREERKLRRFRMARPQRDQAPHDEEDPASGKVLAALRRLPPAQQAALILHYVDDLPVAEVARNLGRSVRATESLLARGRQGFRKGYEESEDA